MIRISPGQLSTPMIKISSLLLVGFWVAPLFAQSNYPPVIEGAETEVYKEIDDIALHLWIFRPTAALEGPQPAIVFFFGGGWSQGSPAQFTKHCAYLADRGMIAITADYRVAKRHGVKATACVADAKSAIRWIRKHAERLGVDPNRIVAGGGSAGGHLAAATALLPGLDDVSDDLSISSTPNALALFNPALVLAPIDGKFSMDEDRQELLSNRLGTDLEAMSPYHHVAGKIGPTIIFHGTGDKTVPFQTAELFQEALKATGSRCELVGYEGEPHGFFNYRRRNNGAFIDSVHKLDVFLVSLGYLPAPPKSSFRP